MADNAQALCEALIRLLEENLAAERSDVTYPETDQSGPPVEMRLRLAAIYQRHDWKDEKRQALADWNSHLDSILMSDRRVGLKQC